MKLRIRGNSLRVRLVQGEVALLARGLPVEQVTEFGPDLKLITRVLASPSVPELTATFDGSLIFLQLPLEQTLLWAAGDQVGLEAEQSVKGGRSLKILIEKDFACLHNEAEAIAGAYPNPRHQA